MALPKNRKTKQKNYVYFSELEPVEDRWLLRSVWAGSPRVSPGPTALHANCSTDAVVHWKVAKFELCNSPV